MKIIDKDGKIKFVSQKSKEGKEEMLKRTGKVETKKEEPQKEKK